MTVRCLEMGGTWPVDDVVVVLCRRVRRVAQPVPPDRHESQRVADEVTRVPTRQAVVELCGGGQGVASQGSSPEPRTMSRVGRVWIAGGELSPFIRSNSSRAASVPTAAGSCAMTVTPGSTTSAKGTSSKPTRATVWCSCLLYTSDAADDLT